MRYNLNLKCLRFLVIPRLDEKTFNIIYNTLKSKSVQVHDLGVSIESSKQLQMIANFDQGKQKLKKIDLS